MGLTLIIVGLLISYFCWLHTESIMDKRVKIQTKLLNNEKLTLSEGLNRYSYKVMYSALKFGFYGGFILSFIGLALFISMIFHFIFR